MLGVTHTHTNYEGQQTSQRLSGVQVLSPGVLYPYRWDQPPSPSSSCFMGTTKPALSSSLKIRGQWDAASVFARLRCTCSLQSARCPGVRTDPTEILAGHPQSPASQQWQGSKLSLLMGYFRAVTVGPESQSAAWLHSTIATWSARKTVKSDVSSPYYSFNHL